MTRTEKARAFGALHVKGDPLVLFNIWDPGSARAVEQAGAKALATGSWSVAAAFGFGDGQAMPLDLVLDNLRRLVAASDLPVSLDFEGGYAVEPAALGANAAAAAEAGAIGVNFEDQVVGSTDLHPVDLQSRRIAAIRSAMPGPLWINARTDLFLKSKPEAHEGHLEAALERCRAYADAGADSFFAPALVDEGLIGRLCEASPLPVNIMMLPGAPSRARLAALGVARISHGPFPYRAMAKWLEGEARTALN